MWDPKETVKSVGLDKRERKRSERVADAVQKELAVLFLQKVRDDKLADVSITGVRVSDDLKNCRVFYTTHGDENARKKTASALEKATGFVRSHIAASLNMRYTPIVRFEYDSKFDKVEELDRIFEEIARERANDDDS